MLTLSLLRHAKSRWSRLGLADRDRPLAPRGEAAAPLMGRTMAEHGLDPQLVLCSSARRARDTLALVLPELRTEPRVIYEDALYHASAAEMLQMLRGVGADAGSLLMIGHNPELHAFALDSIGSGSKRLRERLMLKLPTAGLVMIAFQAGNWGDITVNSGKLTLFLTPKDVEET